MQAGRDISYRSFVAELIRTRVWLLLLARMILFMGTFSMYPFLQTEKTNYFLHKHTDDEDLECTGHHHNSGEDDDDTPEPCKQAHNDVLIWTTGKAVLHAFTVSLFLNPAVGTWSDMYGRKPFLILSFSGHLVVMAVLMLYQHTGLELYWYFVAHFLAVPFNGQSICLAYIADVVQEKYRLMAFGIQALMFSVGAICGTALKLTGLVGDFGTAVIIYGALVLLASLIVAVGLPESLSKDLQMTTRQNVAEKRADSNCFEALAFYWTSLIEAIKILFRTSLFRQLTFIIFIVMIIAEEEMDFRTQYLQEVIDFGTREQAASMMIMGVSGFLSMTVGLWLIKSVLNLTDKQILVLGTAMLTIGTALLATVQTTWMAYLSSGLVAFWPYQSTAVSSIKSVNVHPSEQGAVQGALTAISAIGSGLGPFLFLGLYIPFRSGAVYFPGAPFYLATLLLFISTIVAIRLKVPPVKSNSEAILAKPEDKEPLLPSTA